MSEPWLSGPMEGVNPLVAPLIHSFTQVREDAAAWTEPLTTEQLWAEPHGAGSVGFHIRHAGGAAHNAMRGTIGEAAKLNVRENETDGPTITAWKPFPAARIRPPVRFSGEVAPDAGVPGEALYGEDAP